MSISYSLKHYQNNREKVLQYKREFYFSKTKFLNQFRNICLRGCAKSSSNKYIKDALGNNNMTDKIIINIDDDETLTYSQFYDRYEINKNFSNIFVDWCFCYYDENKAICKSYDKIFDEHGGHILYLTFYTNFLIKK